MKHLLRTIAVTLVLGLLCARAPAAAGDLTVAAELAIPGQTQVMRFIATPGVVYASVRYVPGDPAPADRARRRAAVLVAFEPDGKVRWQADVPEAYQLAMTDGASPRLLLAYDDGRANAERGLLVIDAATGKTVAKTDLDGRPSTLTWYPEAKCAVILMYPQRRMNVIDDETTMEAQGFDQEGRRTWTTRFAGSEIHPIHDDGRTLVVGHGRGADRGADLRASRLDPATGKVLWEVVWAAGLDAPAKAFKAEPDAEGILLRHRHGFAIFDRETGKPLYRHSWPEGIKEVASVRMGPVVYLWRDVAGGGVTMAAYELKSQKLLWADETNTYAPRPPVRWGEDVVFMARRDGRTEDRRGRTEMTELRVYDPAGKLLVHSTEEPPVYWDDLVPPQPVGDRLYAVKKGKLLALERSPAGGGNKPK